MILDVGPVSVYLTEADDRICSHVLDGTGFEPESLQVWAALVKPGRVALDVGSYSGIYAILAAHLGAEAVAIEPMPAQQWRIGVNAKANRVPVRVIAAAASDRCGEATLHHNPKVPLTSGASLEGPHKLHHATLQVSCITVDSLALPSLGIIKVDVERHEPSVIRGAANTIERNRPVLLAETLDDRLRSEVLSLLPDYRVACVLDQRNTLFVPQESIYAAGTIRGHRLP